MTRSPYDKQADPLGTDIACQHDRIAPLLLAMPRFARHGSLSFLSTMTPAATTIHLVIVTQNHYPTSGPLTREWTHLWVFNLGSISLRVSRIHRLHLKIGSGSITIRSMHRQKQLQPSRNADTLSRLMKDKHQRLQTKAPHSIRRPSTPN